MTVWESTVFLGVWSSTVFMLLLLVCDSNAFLVTPTRSTATLNRVLPSTSRRRVAATADPNTGQTLETATSHHLDVQICLETLEQRLQHGPGTCSQSDLDALDAAIARLGEELEAPSSSLTPVLVPPIPPPHINTPEQEAELLAAIRDMNATKVSVLLESGSAILDAPLTAAAFRRTVQAVDAAEAEDRPLPADVATMLHHIFAADHRLLLQRDHYARTNITCMQPDESSGTKGAARRMNYIFDDGDHKNLPLTEGRRCEGGTCCEDCSRNIFSSFLTDSESDMALFPELASFTFNELEKVSAATILQFVRIIERVRRSIAYEYGLPLSSILPLQAYSRKYVAGTTQRGGGGGEGDFVILHTDEATHAGYHYSCVVYLSTQGEDFEGGDFVFNDPAEGDAAVPYADDDEEEEGEGSLDESRAVLSLQEEIRRAGRQLTPFHPSRGAAVIFSSGWENMHEVEKITSGIRYAIPCFFTTCPVPDAAYEQMVAGKPKTTEDIADDWLHLLLAHRKESPMESVGRVKELMMKWHTMCTPLSEHS